MRKGWQQKTVGEVCEVVNGGTPKTNVADYWGDDHLWITPAEMGKRSSPYVSETERKLTELGLGDSSARLLPPLSVILSSRAPIGHLVINTESMATNQGCKGLVPSKLIDHKFLFYYLGSIVRLLNDLGTGATFKELSGGKLKEVPLPVPPLPEQKRIVAILDEAFEGIGTAVANVEKNLANARELFESSLNASLTAWGEDWLNTTIGDQITLQRGFDITKDQQQEGEVPVVSSGGIRSYHNIAMVKNPGVVIGRKGTLGKTFYLDEDFWPHDTTLWVKDFKGNIPHFVYFFLRGLKVVHLDSGAANPALNRNQVHPLKVVWPPTPVQKELVAKFRALSDASDQLESLYTRKLAAIAELKQSLLQKALSGELTASESIAA